MKTGGVDIDDSDVNEYAIDEDGDFIDEDKDLNINTDGELKTGEDDVDDSDVKLCTIL